MGRQKIVVRHRGEKPPGRRAKENRSVYGVGNWKWVTFAKEIRIIPDARKKMKTTRRQVV